MPHPTLHESSTNGTGAGLVELDLSLEKHECAVPFGSISLNERHRLEAFSDIMGNSSVVLLFFSFASRSLIFLISAMVASLLEEVEL